MYDARSWERVEKEVSRGEWWDIIVYTRATEVKSKVAMG